jgi:hypothetical protein
MRELGITLVGTIMTLDNGMAASKYAASLLKVEFLVFE